MNRAQRKAHPWMWLVVGAGAVAVLLWGLSVRSPHTSAAQAAPSAGATP